MNIHFESPDRTPPKASSEVREIDSSELLLGSKTVIIHHNGETYRLTVTRNNRLILQK